MPEAVMSSPVFGRDAAHKELSAGSYNDVETIPHLVPYLAVLAVFVAVSSGQGPVLMGPANVLSPSRLGSPYPILCRDVDTHLRSGV